MWDIWEGKHLNLQLHTFSQNFQLLWTYDKFHRIINKDSFIYGRNVLIYYDRVSSVSYHRTDKRHINTIDSMLKYNTWRVK